MEHPYLTKLSHSRYSIASETPGFHWERPERPPGFHGVINFENVYAVSMFVHI